MYIQTLSIRNIRSIAELDWELEPEECVGWHVFIGDNGSGKSTILRSTSLLLMGYKNALGLRQEWNEWLMNGQEFGYVRLKLLPFHSVVKHTSIDISDFDDNLLRELAVRFTTGKETPTFVIERVGEAKLTDFDEAPKSFSAAFGPFRRFDRHSPTYGFSHLTVSKLAAHESLFESVALTEPLEWLRNLNYKVLENPDGDEARFLNAIKQFVNQEGFLPNGAKFSDVSSDGVKFRDAYGTEVMVENLGDGFHSVLSMTFQILQQMQISYPNLDLFSDDRTEIILPGIVLIDEVDAHLHPTWQKRIGFWFREHFPNIQFIVTTHSPLVCQAADKGSVWKLPTPGTDETCHRVTGQELNRLLYGNILEAYSTALFGITTTRSIDAQEKLDQLAQLNLKEVFVGLSEEERSKQEELRGYLPTVANSTVTSDESTE